MVPILLYHQIAQLVERQDPHRLAVPPRLFEGQMTYLHLHRYRCLDLQEVVRCLHEGVRLPKKCFVLTFDDGYRDFLTAASPILSRFGFTATVFIVAGRMGEVSDWMGQVGSGAAPLLSWQEARELAGQGFTFGSHTVSHASLTAVDGDLTRHH